jgi:hypothetical protein
MWVIFFPNRALWYDHSARLIWKERSLSLAGHREQPVVAQAAATEAWLRN